MISKWLGKVNQISWSLFSLSNEVTEMWTYYTVHFRKLLRCNVPHCSLREATGMRLHCHPTIFTPWLQGTDWPAARELHLYLYPMPAYDWLTGYCWLVGRKASWVDRRSMRRLHYSFLIGLCFTSQIQSESRLRNTFASLPMPPNNMRPAWHN